MRVVATLHNDAGIHNQEWGGHIYLCTGLRRPWPTTWRLLRHLRLDVAVVCPRRRRTHPELPGLGAHQADHEPAWSCGRLGHGPSRETTPTLKPQRACDGVSKHSVHVYVRPMRQMPTWAASVGEEVKAKPQLPRTGHPAWEVFTRDEIDRMERAMPTERHRIIICIFGDCGLRREKLTQLRPKDIVHQGRQAYLAAAGGACY